MDGKVNRKKLLIVLGGMWLAMVAGCMGVLALGVRHLDRAALLSPEIQLSTLDSTLLLLTFALMSFCLVRGIVKQIAGVGEERLFGRVVYVVMSLLGCGVVGLSFCHGLVVIWREGLAPVGLGRVGFSLFTCVIAMMFAFKDVWVPPVDEEKEREKVRETSNAEWVAMAVLGVVGCLLLYPTLRAELVYITGGRPASAQSSQSAEAASGVVRMNIRLPSATVMLAPGEKSVPGADRPIGSGVLVKKVIGDRLRTLLVTARHVAYAGAAITPKREILLWGENGIERIALNDDPWLIDPEKDDDLALVDVTDLGLDYRAIDLDCKESLVCLRSNQLAEHGIVAGAKAVAVCGDPATTNFVPKAGYYAGEKRGYQVFAINAVPGNSGSPVFVCDVEKNVVYFVGIYSLGSTGKHDSMGAVPLDNLYRMIELGADEYFNNDDKRNAQQPRYNVASGVALMKRKGIPHALRLPSEFTWLLPERLDLNGVSYTIERSEAQSNYFVIKDPSGKVVEKGRYTFEPSAFDARVKTFAYACTSRKLTIDELDRRVKCEWVDPEKTTLSLVGVSKARYLVCDTITLVLYARAEGAEDFGVPLLNAMKLRRD